MHVLMHLYNDYYNYYPLHVCMQQLEVESQLWRTGYKKATVYLYLFDNTAESVIITFCMSTSNVLRLPMT